MTLSATQRYTRFEDLIKAELLAILLGLKLAAERNLKIKTVESEIKKKDESLSKWFGLIPTSVMFCFFSMSTVGLINSLAHRVAKLYHVDEAVSRWDFSLPPSFCYAEN